MPRAWVAESTRHQVATDWSKGIWPRHGYQWWLTTAGGDDVCPAYGYGGQMIEVVPALDVVVVMARELKYDNLGSSDIDPHTLPGLVDGAILPRLS